MPETLPNSAATGASTAPLRLAMLGMIEGNGHPYSWSAIINGYNPAAMATCPYPVIPKYLGAEPAGSVRVPHAQVTHVWADNPADAAAVATASLIPHVVGRAEDVIGEVDAVIISTDDGFDHARRARPFIEAGLPVFIDKPLATSLEELRAFVAWEKAGAKILSSSGLRYSPQLAQCRADLPALGELRWLSGVTTKTWEKYGIHLLEPLFCLTGPGFTSVRLESQPGFEVAHLQHRSGVQVTVPVIYDGGSSFGAVQLCGTTGQNSLRFGNTTYQNFRGQMLAFIDFVRTGRATYPFAETVELMAILIAGLRSRAEKSRRVDLAEILSSLSP
jgi:predicted dehydrogenase